MKMHDRKNSTAAEIYLPPLPQSVNGVKECTKRLTHRADKSWKFLFEEIKEIPDAFACNQDYDFSRIDEGKWQSVVVPSSLLMQGFEIQNNTEYYYKRIVSIPQDYRGNCVYLRFEGVYSNARIWVNNTFCASHIGGFTPWDVDITEFADCGTVTLIVGVADLEGNRKSPWNPSGKYQSNSAWASYYAHHNIGGILRDITMFCLPKPSVLQAHIDTAVHGNTASAKVNMTLSPACAGLYCRVNIIRKNEAKATKTIPIHSQNISFTIDVLSADLWDAEHPNLYTLETALYDANGTILQKNAFRFGFREIIYGGKNGTEKNRIYVNGKEIKLRGVCRHDVSGLYGRSITKEDIYHEIKTYKEHNINHIRTSHYPASEYMLAVCDELGMYVEQENAACFKGANGFNIYNPPEDFLNSCKEMIAFSRNHPSVIIWSIANESNFEKSRGFRDCYTYIKQTDRTRPVIFSYPDTVKSKPLPYDIYSKHYAKVTSKLGKSDMPILHDEFAHVPCYNTDDLAYDNSCRVFWGESIQRGWDNIFNTSGALGCDIWAAVDDVFYLPEKRMEKHQSHLKGACAGYGEWGCILDAFQRVKPEAYLTKKAFSPIKIHRTDIHGNQIRLCIQNRFDHTNLNEIRVTVTDDASNVLYSGKLKENIEPHASGSVSLSPLRCTDNMTLEFSANGTVVESTVLQRTYPKISICPQPIHTEYAENFIKISTSEDTSAVIGSMHLYTGLQKFECLHRPLTKVGAHTYAADFGFGRAFLLTAYTEEKQLLIRVKPKNKLSSFYAVGEIGIDIEPAGEVHSVSWQRDALYGDYPQNHIARDCGTAVRAGAPHHYTDTDMYEIPWAQDMSAFAYYEKNSQCNQLASNDFRTKRLKIRKYLVNIINGQRIWIQTDCSNINAYANPFNEKLQISKGHYKPSVLWGNYWGERFHLCQKNTFTFSVSFGQQD